APARSAFRTGELRALAGTPRGVERGGSVRRRNRRLGPACSLLRTPTMIDLLAALCIAAAPPEATTPAEDPMEAYTQPRHFELAMGFIGGVRDETRAGYAFD